MSQEQFARLAGDRYTEISFGWPRGGYGIVDAQRLTRGWYNSTEEEREDAIVARSSTWKDAASQRKYLNDLDRDSRAPVEPLPEGPTTEVPLSRLSAPFLLGNAAEFRLRCAEWEMLGVMPLALAWLGTWALGGLPGRLDATRRALLEKGWSDLGIRPRITVDSQGRWMATLEEVSVEAWGWPLSGAQPTMKGANPLAGGIQEEPDLAMLTRHYLKQSDEMPPVGRRRWITSLWVQATDGDVVELRVFSY